MIDLSKFLQPAIKCLTPYVPGEQPKERDYIKLNTNENPFPPSKRAIERACEEISRSNLYPPLDGGELRLKIAELYGLKKDETAITNGSDEALNFIFKAFCTGSETVFADITYGFYSVFAGLNGAKYREIPLKDDFTLNPSDYIGINKNIFIANPNAPTGLAISIEKINEIAKSNPNNIVVIDEAYVDFGGESALNILRKHQNLIVVRTFSKSRSLAGARIGYVFADPSIIDDLYRVIYSTNPYNLSRASIAAGIGAIEDEEYTRANCEEIKSIREDTYEKLVNLGFEALHSSTNFIFAKPPLMGGKEYYEALRKEGILVRHFNSPRISEYVRISIGTRKQMDELIKTTVKLLNERR